MVTGSQSGLAVQDQSASIQPRSNNLFVLPVVKTDTGLSVSLEVMAGIWEQIVSEGKHEMLFYEGSVNDLTEWIRCMYSPNNHVVLVIDETGHIYHIAWINNFFKGQGFLHHCALGRYHRKTWPTLKKYWQEMKDEHGKPLIRVLMGVTPTFNTLAVKLVKMLGWTVLGEVPGLCYMPQTDRHVSGVISYCQINEV